MEELDDDELFGRSDFIGGIDNEALDFGQLDAFMNAAVATNATAVPAAVATEVSTTTTAARDTANRNGVTIIGGLLPESPPDSGSEPPYSPVDNGLAMTASTLQHPPLQSYFGATDILMTSTSAGPVDTAVPVHPHHSHHNLNTSPLLPSIATLNASSAGVSLLHDQQQDSCSLMHRIMVAIVPPPPPPVQPLSSNSNGNQQSYVAPPPLHETQKSAKQSRKRKNCDLTVTVSEIDAVQPMAGTTAKGKASSPPNTSTKGCYNIKKQSAKKHAKQSRKVASSLGDGLAVAGVCHSFAVDSDESDCVSNNRRIGADLLSAANVTITTLTTPPPKAILFDELAPADEADKHRALDDGTLLCDTEPNSHDGGAHSSSESLNEQGSLLCIRFAVFQPHNWHTLCDQNLQPLSTPHYRVDADKGFNFSNSDDAFVCQKKNHFQVTCHTQLHGSGIFVKTGTGIEKIRSFYLHFYGVKFEAPNQMIRVEQSQSDRSKKPFYPVAVDLTNGQLSKITIGRLHFSETTSNNMRKKGRPNPDQRYFQLIVGLHAHTHTGNFPICSQGSEKIIVRASNPGQFESDSELCWQRGVTHESIYHAGRVGINTDRPDESLVVHGNLKISGHIVQPSDGRAKRAICELNTAQQLENIQKIRVVKYLYEPEFALHSGLVPPRSATAVTTPEIIDTGVIAQEVRDILPDAVHEAGTIVLANGHVLDKFLVVNKDRIFMENVGAVKELCKVTGTLETRIEQLEKVNRRLTKIQKKDCISCATVAAAHKNSKKHCEEDEDDDDDDDDERCSTKIIQIIIIVLIIIMGVCLSAISTLYFVEHNRHNAGYLNVQAYNHYILPSDGMTRSAHAAQTKFSVLYLNRLHGDTADGYGSGYTATTAAKLTVPHRNADSSIIVHSSSDVLSSANHNNNLNKNHLDNNADFIKTESGLLSYDYHHNDPSNANEMAKRPLADADADVGDELLQQENLKTVIHKANIVWPTVSDDVKIKTGVDNALPPLDLVSNSIVDLSTQSWPKKATVNDSEKLPAKLLRISNNNRTVKTISDFIQGTNGDYSDSSTMSNPQQSVYIQTKHIKHSLIGMSQQIPVKCHDEKKLIFSKSIATPLPSYLTVASTLADTVLSNLSDEHEQSDVLPICPDYCIRLSLNDQQKNADTEQNNDINDGKTDDNDHTNINNVLLSPQIDMLDNNLTVITLHNIYDENPVDIHDDHININPNQLATPHKILTVYSSATDNRQADTDTDTAKLSPTLVESVQLSTLPTTTDCQTVIVYFSSPLQSDTLNVTVGHQEVCTANASVYRTVHELSVSKHFKIGPVDLSFVSSSPLIWSICNFTNEPYMNASVNRAKWTASSLVQPFLTDYSATNGNTTASRRHTKQTGYLRTLSDGSARYSFRLPQFGPFGVHLEFRTLFDVAGNRRDDQKDEDICAAASGHLKHSLQYIIQLKRECN